MKRLMLTVVLFAATTVVGVAHSGGRGTLGSESNPSTAPRVLSAKQRGNIARALVQRWAPEVRRQGADVRQWAVKMGRFVGTADTANVRQALDMPTYQTMMGVLQGQPVASKSIQTALAQTADVGIESLGSTISDTTYTPLPNGRCRVADSRVIASPLPGGVSRSLDIEEMVSYATQGGNGTFASGDGSTNCGIPSAATAFAVSVTVLSNGNEGFFKIYENGKPFQTGSTVYYTSTVSASNDAIVTSCATCALELAIYSSSSVDYVVDVVGYFIRNEATALDCTTISGTPTNVAAGAYASLPTLFCPPTYTPMALLISAGENVLVADSYTAGNAGQIFVRSLSVNAQNVTAKMNCCRVPGR